ncbi:MAG: hypothetical protein Kow00120_12500 [Anaerolineae bacterium]
MWLVAEYQATTLFSLKPALATSSGAKTLLLPTPFALKMALLDVVCRTEGVASGEAVWPLLRDLTVALRPVQRVVVNNLFARILKPRRSEARPGEADAGPFQKTIAYREYAHFQGAMAVAVDVSEAETDRVSRWLLGISYLGKRGSFVQLVAPPEPHETLPEGFVVITGEAAAGFAVESVMQQLDDCGESLTFEKANIYTSATIRLGKERVLHHTVLPYRVAASSRAYTLYERT